MMLPRLILPVPIIPLIHRALPWHWPNPAISIGHGKMAAPANLAGLAGATPMTHPTCRRAWLSIRRRRATFSTQPMAIHLDLWTWAPLATVVLALPVMATSTWRSANGCPARLVISTSPETDASIYRSGHQADTACLRHHQWLKQGQISTTGLSAS